MYGLLSRRRKTTSPPSVFFQGKANFTSYKFIPSEEIPILSVTPGQSSPNLIDQHFLVLDSPPRTYVNTVDILVLSPSTNMFALCGRSMRKFKPKNKQNVWESGGEPKVYQNRNLLEDG